MGARERGGGGGSKGVTKLDTKTRYSQPSTLLFALFGPKSAPALRPLCTIKKVVMKDGYSFVNTESVNEALVLLTLRANIRFRFGLRDNGWG